MKCLAALEQKRTVGDFLGKRVFEDVFNVTGGRLLVDELRELQPAEHPIKVVIRRPGNQPNHGQCELPSKHGEGLQQILFVLRQPIDTCRENRLNS